MNLVRPPEAILRALWGLALLALVAAVVAWTLEGRLGAPSVVALLLAVLLGGIAIYLAPEQARAWIQGRPSPSAPTPSWPARPSSASWSC